MNITDSLPLVFLPGLNNTQDVFLDLIQSLPESIECITPEIPSLDSMEMLAKHLLNELPRKFYVVGLSFGGFLALELLKQAPERVKGLVLMATNAAEDSDEQKANRLRLIERASKGEYFQMMQASLEKTLHPESLQNEQLIERRIKMTQAYGAEKFINHATATMNRTAKYDVLREATAPILIMISTEDKVIPSAVSLKIHEAAPKADVVYFNKSGHLISFEEPQLSAEVISNWMSQLKYLEV